MTTAYASPTDTDKYGQPELLIREVMEVGWNDCSDGLEPRTISGLADLLLMDPDGEDAEFFHGYYLEGWRARDDELEVDQVTTDLAVLLTPGV